MQYPLYFNRGISLGQDCLTLFKVSLKGLGFLLLLIFSLPLSASPFKEAPAFQQVFETHSSVMLLIDPASGHIIDANPAAAKFYGYSQHSLRGMFIQQINTLTSEQVKEERLIAESEGRNYFIFRHRLADQSVRTVSVNSHPFMMNKQTLLLSVIHDITPGRHDAQAMWHYQQKLEEMVELKVNEIEHVREQQLWMMWGGLGVQSFVIALLVVNIQRRRRLQRALAEQRKSLANIIWGTDVGTWEWNVISGEATLNERWAQTIGYSLEELGCISIHTWWDFVHPDDVERSKEYLLEHFTGETDAYQCEVRLRHKQGHWVWVQDRGKVVEWTDEGKPLLVSGTHFDISKRKAAEEGLRQAASVFEYANEGIMITDPEGIIQNANHAFSKITGYERGEVVGKNPRILSSGYHDADYFEEMWQTLQEKGSWTNEVWNRRKSGEVFAAMQTVSAVKDDAGNVLRYVSLFSDITALKEQQNKLEKIAHFDALTGLPNRVLLSDRLHQAIARARRFETLIAVVFFDLDGFKAVNDNFGHSIGDRLLVKIASRSESALREGDSLARLGGDEFVVVLQDLESHEAALLIVERLMQMIATPVQIQNHQHRVSASFGLTYFPQMEEIDADQLVRQADQAMYIAKQSGKNRYHIFDAEQDRSIRGKHDKLQRIQDALEANEFVLVYQPKVNMRSGDVIGVEALIRWQHPESGLLSPAEFLPIIEGNQELVITVGEWVIEQALTQIERWRGEGIDLPISVNVDALHLQVPDFVDRIRRLLAQHPRVLPGDLELEVLESSALNDISRVSGIINACREIGISFALDDFGTGYSSLTYLKQLPANLLKIDQSFVRDMLEDMEDLSILEGVLGLANAFRCETIAEGVESVEQGEMLLMMGCELAQGYVIAKPMSPASVPGWLANWTLPQSWRGRNPISRDELPLLFAIVEHRTWYNRVKDSLSQIGKRSEVRHSCQFGRWIAKIDYSRYEDQLDLRQLRSLHDEVHRIADELLHKAHDGENYTYVLKQFDASFKAFLQGLTSMLR